MKNSQNKNILLGLTGSVASIKAKELINLLSKNNEVKVVGTESAKHFLDINVELLDDKTEWSQWQKKGDPVLHIELRKWADIFLIAPLSANTLAKLAHGLCDNLLTSVARAWDFSKPFYVAPAMNTFMWEHPSTKEHLDKIESWNIKVISPIEKLLACGDEGMGAMQEPSKIAEAIFDGS